jgi:hypothetical protein
MESIAIPWQSLGHSIEADIELTACPRILNTMMELLWRYMNFLHLVTTVTSSNSVCSFLSCSILYFLRTFLTESVYTGV